MDFQVNKEPRSSRPKTEQEALRQGDIWFFLGKVTWPSFVESLIRDPLEETFKKRRGNILIPSLNSQKDRAVRESPETEAINTQWVNQQIKKYEEKDREYIEEEVRATRERLIATSSMTKMRDKAKAIADAFIDGSPNAKRHLLRKAHKLWQEMNGYVRDYLQFRGGLIKVESLDLSTEEIVASMQDQFEKVIFIRSDVQTVEDIKKEGIPKIEFSLPTEHNSDWDTENISIRASKEGDITSLSFDEKFSTAYCVNLEQLTKAYELGAKLTSSQMQLLIDQNLVSTSSLIEGRAIKINNEAGQKLQIAPLLFSP